MGKTPDQWYELLSRVYGHGWRQVTLNPDDFVELVKEYLQLRHIRTIAQALESKITKDMPFWEEMNSLTKALQDMDGMVAPSKPDESSQVVPIANSGLSESERDRVRRASFAEIRDLLSVTSENPLIALDKYLEEYPDVDSLWNAMHAEENLSGDPCPSCKGIAMHREFCMVGIMDRLRRGENLKVTDKYTYAGTLPADTFLNEIEVKDMTQPAEVVNVFTCSGCGRQTCIADLKGRICYASLPNGNKCAGTFC